MVPFDTPSAADLQAGLLLIGISRAKQKIDFVV